MEREEELQMERGAEMLWFPVAQAMASKIFANARVRIHWRKARGCPSTAIFINVSTDPNNRRNPGALAYALPYEGVHILIFYDRVQKATDPASAPYVMAHVLVHEVTHILEGVSRHSDSGVMKAQWTAEDYFQMCRKPLPFTAEDIDLIQSGVGVQNRRMAALK